jgi:nucleoside-diphosphate-sugar epimerase
LVYAPDLAEAIVGCLDHPAAPRKTYFVAAPEVVTARQMAAEVAWQMNVWAIPLPLPTPLFFPLCLIQDVWSRLTGKPNVLSLQKYAELRASGWVCDSKRLAEDTGYVCPTHLRQGMGETLAWYREHGWL